MVIKVEKRRSKEILDDLTNWQKTMKTYELFSFTWVRGTGKEMIAYAVQPVGCM